MSTIAVREPTDQAGVYYVELDDQGMCHECKEWASVAGYTYRDCDDLDEVFSSCCGAGIDTHHVDLTIYEQFEQFSERNKD